MSDFGTWEDGNARYLAAGLEWLRSCLEQPGRPDPASDQHLARAEKDMLALESTMDPPPALELLSRRLGLSRFEQRVLLLGTAIELDTRIAELCGRAQGDPGRAYPTFALAFSMFEDAAWDVLSPERPLRYWRLIEISQHSGQALITSPLRVDERIVSYLKGLNYLDDRLSALVTPVRIENDGAKLPPSQRLVVDAVVQRWRRAGEAMRPVVQMLGFDAQSKQLVAWHAAAEVGLHLYRLPVDLLPGQPGELDSLARLWQRESTLLPLALYLDGQELDGAADATGAPLRRFLNRSDALFFLATREPWPRLGRDALTLDVHRPMPNEQQAAWIEALGAAAAESPELLAGQFNLSAAAIRQIGETTLAEPESAGATLAERLWDACRISVRPRMDALAQRLDAKATWDDIVLPDDRVSLLRQIAGQVGRRTKVYQEWGFAKRMNRGLGISALFAGDSGTGKTMAAEVIANDLRLNLYRIDLSAVVSKYIGETEKNLRRLFDAAEDGGVILFFDEADALFGKRSEVKDSHDRYANIEVNYLLQRIESYRGLAILATNMKSALDGAFMRRLRFVVEFPFPGVAERRAMWQKVFPAETPTAGLDFDRLARFNLTGGNIHIIGLNAAFLAAQRNSRVTMPLVLEAARTEFRKLDRPVDEGDFIWRAPGGVDS